MAKSTIQEIKERFDKDVERFSNLETGQTSTIDADISLELITAIAAKIKPWASNVLDIGCGAGNYTLKMLSKLPNLNCTLVDLSRPMLTRAYERVKENTSGKIEIIEGDIRVVPLPQNNYDIILAGAVLHHLRDEQDWKNVFEKLFNLLKSGGCLMVSDLIEQDSELISEYFRERYGEYLEKIGGPVYQKKVLDYIEKEDSPRSLNFQIELMKKVGFSKTEILHKNGCFAAFCGIR